MEKLKTIKIYKIKYLVLFFVVICLVVSGIVVKGKTKDNLEVKLNKKNNNLVSVYIHGEVRYPGFYNLSSTSTIEDVINSASGLTDIADISLININKVIEEGESIYIPKNENNNIKIKININTASLEQLMMLSGIGKEKASSIILYRVNYGPFNTTDDLLNVPGITKNILMNIMDEIKLS